MSSKHYIAPSGLFPILQQYYKIKLQNFNLKSYTHLHLG